MDLERLDPDDDDQLMFLMEAHHEEYQDALEGDEELIANGQSFSPRLHVAMHHIVAKQLLADDPPHTWQTAQRLVGLGYDWHNIMHMIASVISDDIYLVMTEQRRPDLADYSRRLDELPGDWPLPRPGPAR